MLEQVQALENGRGIQFLIDSAYVIFNNPLYMLDSYYNLIAASDGPMELVVWSEMIKTGTLGANVKEALAKAGILSVVSPSEKPIYFPKRENWSGGIITMTVMNRDNSRVAQVTMYDHYLPFGEDVPDAFGMLVKKISYEIRDYDYFIHLPFIYFDDAVNKLLDRNSPATLYNYSQAQLIRYEHKEYLYVAVVSTARYDMLKNVHSSRLAYFSSLLKARYHAYRYAVYEDNIVMLISSEHKDYSEALPFGQDHSLFEYNDLYAGVSESFDNIYDFCKYYDQATTTLRNNLESENTHGQRVFCK